MSDQRTEILSIRLSAAEKQRLQEAVARWNSLSGVGKLTISDWGRARLLEHADDPVVFPSQRITVSVLPDRLPMEVDDAITSLRKSLQAVERMKAAGMKALTA